MTEIKIFSDLLQRAVSLILIFTFFIMPFGASQAFGQDERKNPYEKFARADVVTTLARDKQSVFHRILLRHERERRELEKKFRIVEDYGSFVIAASRANAELSGFDAQKMETTVHLPSGSFDPILNPPAETFRPNAKAEKNSVKEYFIVQFVGATRDEWLESLKEIGAEVLQYVPHNAFFVYADGEAAEKIAAHSRVRWIGRYAPENKISPEMRENLSRAASGEVSAFDVAVFKRANVEEIAAKISNAPFAKVLNISRLPHNFFDVVRVEIPAGGVSEIAKIADVVRIDPYIKPTREDERAAQIVAGNYLNSVTLSGPGYNPLAQFGVNGAGVTVSVVDDGVGIPGDGGFYITQDKAVNANLRNAEPGAVGHGHLNATIIAGDAPFSTLDNLGYNYGLGVAPKANIINVPFLRFNPDYTGTYADTINDTLTTVAPNGVTGFIANNSWGAGLGGNSYDSLAAQYDGFVQDGTLDATIEPIVIIFSAGNSGTSGMTRPKAAKNIIAVANSENLRPEISQTGNNIEDINSSSSRGPATDGRVKPDITAPGTVVTGGRSGMDFLFGNIDDFHRWSSGTSHAAPQVAGAAALFTQFWKNQNSGQNPSPALVKAALINTAQEVTGFGAEAPRPNGSEGWGRINLKYMLNTGVPVRYVNQTVRFSNTGESWSISGRVADSSKPVRVTLVWTDPPGVGNPALVNNLDLTVNIGGVIYRGNVFSNGMSDKDGTHDTVNNVENVFLPAGIPAGTPFSIQVTAAALNGDGILNNSDPTDQHFGLVAYNFEETAAVVSNENSDFDGDGKSDVSVFRPSGGQWFISNSSNGAFVGSQFGTDGDVIVPGDYDGDGKTDTAVFRPSNGSWYIMRSLLGFTGAQFGSSGDIPTQADYDGDGKTDIAVWRPSDGTWYRLNSSNGQFVAVQFGLNGDKPVPADYDGDGKTDIVVWRPSDGTWYRLNSSNGQFVAVQFGMAGDKPVPGDYDGDGKADSAVYRPANGTWYLLKTADGFTGLQFGLASDVPSPADYDGDGKTDIAVFRNGSWYIQRSTQGFISVGFGLPGDKPVPSGYLPQ